MKVVQISTWNVPCGIAGYTKGLVNGMLKHGIECDVLPIDRQELNYMSRNEVTSYFDLYTDKLSSGAYDIIHIQHEFGFFAGSYGPDVSMYSFNKWVKSIAKLRKPIFVTFHSEPSFLKGRPPGILGLAKKKRLQYLWELQIASLFNSKKNLYSIIHTKNSRRQFLDSGFDKEKICLIKQGVTLTPKGPVDELQKTILKKQYGFPENSVVLAMFGFISTYKGYLTAIRALKYLPDNYHLLIIGMPHPQANDTAFDNILGMMAASKEKEKELLNSGSAHNPVKALHERVKLAGYVEYEELQNYYKVVDISLAPYIADANISSSAAITWALSSGKPVIASRVPAFAELNEDVNCLCTVTPDTPGELAYRVQEVINNENLRAQLVANALKYCESNQWSNIGKEHIDLYARIAKTSR
jgi:glycosyltransferase involved in cell wall biosynthesis